MIIGQIELLTQIGNLVTADRFPQFSIIVGQKGSGKKLVAEYIARALNVDTVSVVLPKMENVQYMIDTARSTSDTVAFLLFDADTMSTQSKNATLKLFEEPPKNIYFIMTASDLGNILTTIISRAQVFYIKPYSSIEIVNYAKTKNSNLSDDEISLITSICEVPGEVDKLLETDLKQFYEYVNKVVDSIATVSGANSFKIAEKLNLKDDSDKYDVALFLKAFMIICLNTSNTDTLNKLNAVTTTSEYIGELALSGANKQMIIDNWILSIRKLWM